MAAEDMEIRQVIDWNYYRGRLDAAIQKIISIPAALQHVITGPRRGSRCTRFR